MKQPDLLKNLPGEPRQCELEGAEWLRRLLWQSGQWLTCREIIRYSADRTCEREVRRWAEVAEGEVISGQLGYRHTQRATAEEIQHACDWLESQAQRMMERSVRTRRRAHQLIR